MKIVDISSKSITIEAETEIEEELLERWEDDHKCTFRITRYVLSQNSMQRKTRGNLTLSKDE